MTDWNAVLEAARPAMLRTARRCGCGQEAEDVVQQAMAKAWVLRHALVNSSTNLLCRMVRGLASNARRADYARRRLEQAYAAGRPASQEPGSANAYLSYFPSHLHALALAYMDGATTAEAARDLDCPDSTLRRRRSELAEWVQAQEE